SLGWGSRLRRYFHARLRRAPPSQPSPASGGRRSIQNSAPAHATLEARGGAAHRQLQLADGLDALLGQTVGGLVGGDAVAVGDLVDAPEVVVDRAHHPHRAFAVVAVDLQRDV